MSVRRTVEGRHGQSRIRRITFETAGALA